MSGCAEVNVVIEQFVSGGVEPFVTWEELLSVDQDDSFL